LARIADRLTTMFRLAVSREALPAPSPAGPPRPRQPSLLRRLFAPEPLPLEVAATSPAKARSLLRLLFAPERLPEAAAAVPRRHSPWLRWLLAPEKLEEGPSGKEGR
jgi:hypothetical protein